MMMRGQRFSNLVTARKAAKEVADNMECNIPIYYDAPFYYHWIAKELIEWVKPTIINDDGY